MKTFCPILYGKFSRVKQEYISGKEAIRHLLRYNLVESAALGGKELFFWTFFGGWEAVNENTFYSMNILWNDISEGRELWETGKVGTSGAQNPGK